MQSLRSAKAVLMEASLLAANAGAPLIFDVMKFMDSHGFRLEAIRKVSALIVPFHAAGR